MKRLLSVLFALVLALSLVTAAAADAPAITEQEIRELVIAYQESAQSPAYIRALIEQGTAWDASAIMALVEEKGRIIDYLEGVPE